MQSLNLSKAIPLMVALGYACLISYTWPYGFIPIGSTAAIPALLLGSFLLLAGLLLLQVVMFFPIVLYQKQVGFLDFALWKESADDEGIHTYPLGMVKERYQSLERGSATPIKDCALLVVYILLLLITLSYALSCIGFLITIVVYSWVYVIVEFDYPTILLIPWMAAVLYSFSRIFKEDPRKEDYIKSGSFLFLLVVIAPMLGVHHGDGEKNNLVPNRFVSKALRISGVGGEIPVKLLGNINLSAKLIFFDGERAWYIRCEDHGRLEMAIVDAVRLDTTNDCRQPQTH